MKKRLILCVLPFLFLAACEAIAVRIENATPIPVVVEPEQTTALGVQLPPAYTLTRTPTQAISLTPTRLVSPAVAVWPIAAGSNFTCAVMASGGVKCWGNNEHGQLGNGGTVNSNVPVDVIGVTDAAAITAGWGHTCAITGEGGVKCWGYNKNGELGNGTSVDSSVPVDVIGLNGGAIAIEAGDDHTCAVTGGGRVLCWGYNEYGQLGDGTKASRSLPIEAQGFTSGIKAVAAGWGHTCALTENGGVKCWGNNEYGQLGHGQEEEYRLTAVNVIGLGSGVVEITADGGNTCARTAGGRVKCWGNNKYGQLGDGTVEYRNSPVDAGGLTQNAIRIAAGWNHTCAVTGNGELKCWGWNYYGQLGDGTKASRLKPVKVTGLTDGVEAIGMGREHTCVVTDLGGVRCWGSNENGQLGDGTNMDSPVPMAAEGIRSSLVPLRTNTPTETHIHTPTKTPTKTPSKTLTSTPTKTAAIHAFSAVIAITSQNAFTCALTSEGGVKCWGDNGFGQLGDGTTSNRSLPVDVNGLSSGVTALAAGGDHTCALTTVGGVKCWGGNWTGQLGDGTMTDRLAPVDVSGLSRGVTALAAGPEHTCALMEDGGAKCWGSNFYGQLGDGTMMYRLTPVDVSGLSSGVTALAAGGDHTCALTTAGGVKCWGSNEAGQLGDGTMTDRFAPVDVSGLSSGVTALATRFFHTCALTAAGGVKCWGDNDFGQMGDGTRVTYRTPVDASGLGSGVMALTVGGKHTCALMVGGGVKCWGANWTGQLGDSTTTDRLSPVDVSGLSSAVTTLAAGSEHTCALMAGGGLKCWGFNNCGQLGNGTTTNSTIPVDVIQSEGTARPVSQSTPTPSNSLKIEPTRTFTPTPN